MLDPSHALPRGDGTEGGERIPLLVHADTNVFGNAASRRDTDQSWLPPDRQNILIRRRRPALAWTAPTRDLNPAVI
jgi:hypothetical protein